MRHSLKIKLTLIMASLVTAVVVLICVLNTTMFEKFYIKSRLNDLKNAYSSLTNVLSIKNTDSDAVQDIILMSLCLTADGILSTALRRAMKMS